MARKTNKIKGDKMRKKIKPKIGEYFPEGKQWDIKLEDNCYFTVKRQEDAEIISRLVRIERKLNKKVK